MKRSRFEKRVVRAAHDDADVGPRLQLRMLRKGPQQGDVVFLVINPAGEQDDRQIAPPCVDITRDDRLQKCGGCFLAVVAAGSVEHGKVDAGRDHGKLAIVVWIDGRAIGRVAVLLEALLARTGDDLAGPVHGQPLARQSLRKMEALV